MSRCVCNVIEPRSAAQFAIAPCVSEHSREQSTVSKAALPSPVPAGPAPGRRVSMG